MSSKYFCVHSIWKNVEKYRKIVCFFQPQMVRLGKYRIGGYSRTGVYTVTTFSYEKRSFVTVSPMNQHAANTNCSKFHIFCAKVSFVPKEVRLANWHR